MIQKILKVLITMFLFASAWIVHAANVDHYIVTVSPETVAVWEAVDLVIDVVDRDSNPVTDYEWTILIISESDSEAEFPQAIEDSTYTFSKSDLWSVKFENWVKFKNKWRNDIHVYDLTDETNSIFGIAEVQVTEVSEVQDIEIKILSPENGLTIWAKEITVSWTSQKNHQIKIVLNNDEEILTTTNNSWVFEKTIEWLPTGESTINAYVLDSNWTEIGMSEQVIITSDSTKPILNAVKITPEWEVEPETDILIEVYATKWLSEVSVIIDEALYVLKEDEPGIYKSNILSPREVWEYIVQAVLKDELWHSTTQAWTIPVVVIPKLEAAPVPEIVEEKVKDVCKDWDYTGDVFDWECWEEPIIPLNAPIDLWIKNLRLVQLKTKSVLTWDELSDASAYEVYKKMEWDELELIETVYTPKYEVNIIWDDITYEYFAVKAIWKQEFTDTENEDEKIVKDIEWDLSDAIKIQTWPEAIMIVLIAIMISIWIFLFNRRNSFIK